MTDTVDISREAVEREIVALLDRRSSLSWSHRESSVAMLRALRAALDIERKANASLDALCAKRLDEIAALESELAQLRRAVGWQPIATAPKDGSPIIIRSGNAYGVVLWTTGELLPGWRDGWQACEIPKTFMEWHPIDTGSEPAEPHNAKEGAKP